MKRMSPGPSDVSRPTRSPGRSSTGPERGAALHAHLARHQHRERGLAETGRPEEEDVIERFAALLGGVDGDLERRAHLLLADEFVEPRRAQHRLGARLVGRARPAW